MNKDHLAQLEKAKIIASSLPDDYCGPCYGAQKEDSQCCNTCDEVLEAYSAKHWSTTGVLASSEQCIREGRDTKTRADKPLKQGEGCNLAGFMTVNQISGNFHIAMGEGVERDGRHIHSYKAENAPSYNVSHIIHELSFGPQARSVVSSKKSKKGEDAAELTSADVSRANSQERNHQQSLKGVEKIVSKVHGTTGTFQYFIKVVPTSYVYSAAGVQESVIETNRYFYTERFRPLMKEYVEDDDEEEEGKQAGGKVTVSGGHAGGHSHKGHHDVRNSAVLPGVFFIYEIYPFAVEVHRNYVPWTHLLIRLMATVGGVFTIVGWVDAFLYSRERDLRKSSARR
jgi:endoplasmic reticulum-Golgi intermediate compartment protein 3